MHLDYPKYWCHTEVFSDTYSIFPFVQVCRSLLPSASCCCRMIILSCYRTLYLDLINQQLYFLKICLLCDSPNLEWQSIGHIFYRHLSIYAVLIAIEGCLLFNWLMTCGRFQLCQTKLVSPRGRTCQQTTARSFHYRIKFKTNELGSVFES